MNETKKDYVTPQISRVMLEDRRVVAMAACKTNVSGDDCNVPQGACVIDTIPCLDLNPS